MTAQFASNSGNDQNDSSKPQPLDPQPLRQITIDWLLTLELPPLPVAPAQDPHLYPLRDKSGAVVLDKEGNPKPKFTGKNPSYLDDNDKPHLVTHSKLKARQPTEDELKAWFGNPLNGIGTLGNENCIWIDFDVKNFTDEVECSVKVWAVVGKVKEISGYDPTVERTHSGGWRVQVYVEQKPNFTNFALEPGGKYVGEALGVGRFTVLAPTIGPSGDSYVTYHRHCPNSKPIVPNLEAIGIYPSSKSKSKSKVSQPLPTLPLEETTPTDTPVSGNEDASETPPTDTPVSGSEDASDIPLDAIPPHKPTEVGGGTIPLRAFGSKDSQEVLSGIKVAKDNSGSLTLAYREWCGWENWLGRHGSKLGVNFSESAKALAYEAWDKLGIKDLERLERILHGIDASGCTPGIYSFEGDGGCLKKVRAVAKEYGVKVDARRDAKVIPLPTATPLPKAVGGNDNSLPLPPNYGGGRGGFDGDNDGVDWNTPVAYKGHLGVWRQPKKDEPPEFEAKCNFDFVVLKDFERYVPEGSEPSDPDGGGLQLKVTCATDGITKTVLISSQDYATAKTFTATLKSALGKGIRCRISDYELQALIETKVSEYHRKGGKVYTLASLIGQQPDGTWVFPKVQFTPSGQTLTDGDNLWIFNTNVSAIDKLPYPNIPVEQDVTVLTELIHAIKDVAGTNKNRWLLALGWVAMWLNKWHIPHNNLPVLASYGNPGTLKTRKMFAALSVIWGDEETKNLLRKTSESYLYEILSRLTVPFLWDDAKATNKDERKVIDNVIIDVYGRLPRRVRGQDQTPQTSMLITSNPQLGDALDAAQSRLFHIFLPQASVKPTSQALRRLKNAKKEAPKAFSGLIGIGYDEDTVEELTDTLRERLPTAHDRAPHHLALVVFYTQKVLELAGVNENILTWVLDEFCSDVNSDQSSIDALTDFFERLRAAQVNSYVGEWCGRTTSGNDGKEYLALYMPSVWPAITRKEIGGEPSSYNQRMVERLLKEKGAKGGTVRLAASKLQVDTQTIAKAQGKDPSELGVVPEIPRYCLKIPHSVWEAYTKSDDPVMSLPKNHITKVNVDGVKASASTSTLGNEFCNVDVQKNITNGNVDGESVSPSTTTPCNECNECNVGDEGSVEKKVGVEADVSKISLTSDVTNNHSETNYANPASLLPENTLHTLQAPNANAENSSKHTVQDVMNSVMSLPCNDITSENVEVTPDLTPELALAAELIHCNTWAKVQEKTVGVPPELYSEALAALEDSGARIRRLQTDALAQASTPNLESPTPNANLSPAAPEVAHPPALTPIAQTTTNKEASTTDAELVREAKRQGKEVFRYVGPMFPSGAHCLAPNVLVERLGVDQFGLLVSVQKLGEVWEIPIKVGEKWLEEVSD